MVHKATKVTVRFVAGLGNQLFQYAAARALAARWNINEIVADTSFYKSKQRGQLFASFPRNYLIWKLKVKLKEPAGFKETATCTIYRQVIRCMGRLGISLGPFYIENTFLYNKEFFRKPWLYIQGYFNSEMYFHALRSELLQELQLFDTERQRELQQEISLLKDGKPLVAIHMRRGDNLLPFNDNHCPLEDGYVPTAKRYMPSNSRFLVFSDDIPWCKQNFTDKSTIIYENEDPVENVLAMSFCDHFIIANSTFSWWGAWLSESKDKIIVAPKRWFGPRGNHLSLETLFPRGWIVI